MSYVVPVKSNGKISQNFVAFSEYMNFTTGNAKMLVKNLQDKKGFYSQQKNSY